MRLLLLLAPLALFLAACASLSEEGCRRGDWRGVGFSDGAAGRSEAQVARHAEACAGIGITPDVAAWRAGRAEGLKLYCTQQNAYAIGRRGATLNHVCEGPDARSLAQLNAQGLQYHDITEEMRRTLSEIRLLNARIDSLLASEVTENSRRQIRAYRSEQSWLELRLRRLERDRFFYGRPRV